MAGQALAIADGFPQARIIGVEPESAATFANPWGRKAGASEHPHSICDGLLSYDVGQHDWPILQRLVAAGVGCDRTTEQAMKWLYDKHGLRTEPSGPMPAAAAFSGTVQLDGDGDIVIVLSGRNVDEESFRT